LKDNPPVSSTPLLIVDDHAINLKLLEFVLRAQGYEVRTAGDAESAREMLAEWLPRLILLDLQLPGMSGLEFARLLRSEKRFQSVLIVAVTAFAMKGDDRVATDAGCDAYLSKPINTRTLPEFIKTLLMARASGPLPTIGADT
jgi:two-component system cell cycle response regulator